MTPQELISYYQSFTFDGVMGDLLQQVSNNVDKRVGSIIYDALAPAATKLVAQYQNLAFIVKESYTVTADNEFLDARASERGTSRENATYAQLTARLTDDSNNLLSNVSRGDRFSSIGDNPIFYSVVRINNDLTVLLQSEELGTRSNSYIGQIIPVTPNDSLNYAEITSLEVPAKDQEDDESLRERLLTSNSYVAYGGNTTDYDDMVSKIDSVGNHQVYPSYKGGGTVKLVVLNNDLNPASQELVNQVKETIDPAETTGQGYGKAPIGHSVDVEAPTVKNITVKTTVQVDDSVTINSLKSQLNEAIENYFKQQRSQWGKRENHKYSVTLYRAQILSEIVKVPHVVNATLPTLNDSESDITLQLDNDKSELPILSEVVYE